MKLIILNINFSQSIVDKLVNQISLLDVFVRFDSSRKHSSVVFFVYIRAEQIAHSYQSYHNNSKYLSKTFGLGKRTFKGFILIPNIPDNTYHQKAYNRYFFGIEQEVIELTSVRV